MPGSEEIYNCVDLLQRCTNQIMSNCRTICEIVCMKLFHSVSADYPSEKSRITAYVKTTENVMNYRTLRHIFAIDRWWLCWIMTRHVGKGFLCPVHTRMAMYSRTTRAWINHSIRYYQKLPSLISCRPICRRRRRRRRRLPVSQ